MRIHVANPNGTEAMTATIATAARAAAAPGTEIVATTATGAPASIEGPLDGAHATPFLLDRIAGTQADAHVIACFDDTALDAARALVRAPVVGIGEAACLLATQLADSFCVVTSAAISVPVLEANLRRTGLIARCAGVRAAGVPVLEIGGHAAGAEDPVAEAVRRAARDHPGAALVLGCGGMAALAGDLSRELGRPVIDGVAAAVVLAEGLARLGHRTLRLA
ncbi:aspartate/glutamate racemase family protein [Mesobaculum littorinae]|uniref:Aspartate/glutamate racemase family protein n=1 Tax=Mesobaculum littorinae TaxID=2486419 RepID=A0A438AHR4_9RHOB|nr:aspartate/glutamate racemase family protein [Mesobaculum littorinae]RVV98204.1 aspartate/glutamate racemase family protein [Mesobaculum littorinae]